ncbi:MAG: ATP-binding cassette domain-containing protein [Pseudomonadota bacterium]
MSAVPESLPDREPVIELSNIVTRFGSKVVHDGIDLTIYRHEVFAVVGGSGSGKSTLMREAVMLQEPTEGTVELFGQDVTNLGELASLPVRRRIGVMFQYGALFSDMTVLENVGMPLREHTSLDRGLIDEIAGIKLSLAGLSPTVGALYPSELSGGMRKRAAMARAIALDPELLVLDEPGSGLDPVSAAALDDLIVSLRDLLGLTIVMITHDMASVRRIADRVAFLGDGKLLALGEPATLAQSRDERVRDFFVEREVGECGEALGQPEG